MKQFLFAGLLLSVIACKPVKHTSGSVFDSSHNQKVQDTATIEGNWQLMPVLPSDTAAGKIPQIKFDLKANKFSGNTGCNNMAGSFIVKGDALSFGENVISTRMACPGYNEKPFLDNLLKTNRYEIKNGVLQLMYNTTILSKWVRHLDSTVTKQI